MAFAGLVGKISGLRGGQGAPTRGRSFGGTASSGTPNQGAPISGRVQQRTPIPQQSQVVERMPEAKTTLQVPVAEAGLPETNPQQNQPIDENPQVQGAIRQGAQQLAQNRGSKLGRNKYLAFLRQRQASGRR